MPNREIAFGVGGNDADFNRMLVSELEHKNRVLGDENFQLRECLKTVQRELVETVSLEASLLDGGKELEG